MIKIERYENCYYSLNCEEKDEGKIVHSMDKKYLINAFKKMILIDRHENNFEWVDHNLKVLEDEIIRRIN